MRVRRPSGCLSAPPTAPESLRSKRGERIDGCLRNCSSCRTPRNGSPAALSPSWRRCTWLVPSAMGLCATKCKRCPFGSRLYWIWPTRACQVVGPAVSHFLARNYGFNLAVPTRMGTYCVGSLFPNRDSHDVGDWSCLRDRNCLQSPVADGGEFIRGTRLGGPIRNTPITSLSNQFDSVRRLSLSA